VTLPISLEDKDYQPSGRLADTGVDWPVRAVVVQAIKRQAPHHPPSKCEGIDFVHEKVSRGASPRTDHAAMPVDFMAGVLIEAWGDVSVDMPSEARSREPVCEFHGPQRIPDRIEGLLTEGAQRLIR